jgi:hypothetical protein
MKPEIKQKWVEALRSGDYKQTKGMLRRTTPEQSYCCLGVLTDLYIKENNGNWNNYAGKTSLTHSVKEWAGLKVNDPTLTRNHGNIISCIIANDKCGYGFNKIADLVEENL